VSGYLGPRLSILIVDDTPENRAMLADTLRGMGFEIHEAGNGLEGLEQARTVRPDLILMDVMMPVMDGLEATRRIRQSPDLQSTPIISASASVAAEDQKRSLAAGANAFLTKPIEHRHLLHEIGRLLELSWVDAPMQPAASASDGVGLLVVPPQSEMNLLRDLARAGNMRNIKKRAEHLAALDGQYRPFADKLQKLARDYDSQGVMRLVEQYKEQKHAAGSVVGMLN
jgi:CheY-like chemotaxis protein